MWVKISGVPGGGGTGRPQGQRTRCPACPRHEVDALARQLQPRDEQPEHDVDQLRLGAQQDARLGPCRGGGDSY